MWYTIGRKEVKGGMCYDKIIFSSVKIYFTRQVKSLGRGSHLPEITVD